MYKNTDITSQHAILFEIITNFDKNAAKGLRIWKQNKLQLKKTNETIEPLHESIFPFITELHVLWITTPQVYDVCDLHHTPHYSLTFEETQNLLHLMQYTNITIVEYFTDKN